MSKVIKNLVGHKWWMRDPKWTPMHRTKQEWIPISRWRFYTIKFAKWWHSLPRWFRWSLIVIEAVTVVTAVAILTR